MMATGKVARSLEDVAQEPSLSGTLVVEEYRKLSSRARKWARIGWMKLCSRLGTVFVSSLYPSLKTTSFKGVTTAVRNDWVCHELQGYWTKSALDALTKGVYGTCGRGVHLSIGQ